MSAASPSLTSTASTITCVLIQRRNPIHAANVGNLSLEGTTLRGISVHTPERHSSSYWYEGFTQYCYFYALFMHTLTKDTPYRFHDCSHFTLSKSVLRSPIIHSHLLKLCFMMMRKYPMGMVTHGCECMKKSWISDFSFWWSSAANKSARPPYSHALNKGRMPVIFTQSWLRNM